MDRYKPNKRIIEKVASLWCDLITNPHYDNGDKSRTGAACWALATMNHKSPEREQLEKFRKELVRLLNVQSDYGAYLQSLHVDYGPDGTLACAANAADMDVGIIGFPWKTNCFIYENYFSLSLGYTAESVYYYPLKDDKWLITKLSGSDIEKVIEYINGGKPEFTIEDDNPFDEPKEAKHEGQEEKEDQAEGNVLR